MKSFLYKALLVFSIFLMRFSSAFAMSVYVSETCASWCSAPTGILEAQISGGTAPYNYTWDNGGTTAIISGLYSGNYSLIVTDALGTTATAIGTVDDIPLPSFYVISIVMANRGMANGSVEFGVYPGMATQIPSGQIDYTLFDSTGVTIVNSTSVNCPGNCNPYYSVNNLAKGHYTAWINILSASCSGYVEFDITEMPEINPSASSMASCNGSPTGRVAVNLHPQTVLSPATFNAGTSGTVSQSNPVYMAYKCILLDALNTPVKEVNSTDSALTMYGVTPGNYQLKIYTGDTLEQNLNPYLHDSLLVYTGNILVANDPTCSYVMGKVFADYNHTCTYVYPDRLLPGTLIELNPGGYSATADANGSFYIPIPNGTYTLKQHTPFQFEQICPDTNTFSIVNTTPGSIFTVSIADSVSVSPDLLIGITGNTARPGMAVNYVIGFGNTTPNIIAAQTVSFTADPSLIFNSAFPTPASIVGNVYTWNTSSFSPFANHYLTLHFTVPATTPLGTTLTNSATISIASGETITSNNTDYLVQTVTGSYDPNEKSVYPTGIGNDGYVTDDQLLRYTIDFQNTGTDTAFNIVVVDTLPAALDKYSLQVLASSHAYTYEFKSGNVVAFHFNNVLLIDSTTNEQASHGYIKFSIAQKPGNAVGTTIDNTAAIYFDYNAPVLTNAVHNTVFNCNAMATPVYSDTVICDGEIISASANLLFPMSSTWYIDNALFASDSSTVLSGFSVGNHTVSLHAENAACSLNISTNVDVYALPVKPTFVQNTGLLTSSSLSDNQWLLNGTLISGATGQTFAAIVSGYYSVMVTNANGCSNVSDSAYITLSGLHSPQGNEAIIVSPNPVNDVLNISNIELQPNAIITICDNLGGIVFEKKIDAACNNFTVSTITFAPGLYLLQIHASKGLLIRKFTKN